MALPEFEFIQASNLDEALNLLSKYGEDAKLAGGTTVLLTMLQQGVIQPQCVVGTSNLNELRYIKIEDGVLHIGGLTTHRDIERSDVIKNSSMGILAQMERDVASVQIRNRGTIGGNLAYAEPNCDPPPVLVALNADVELTSVSGKRTVSINKFIKGFFDADVMPDEIITEIRMPVIPDTYGAYYYKFTQRKAMDKPFIGVAAVLSVENNMFKEVRIVVGSMTEKPFRCTKVEELLKGYAVSAEVILKASRLAGEGVRVLPDIRCSEEYRLKVLPVIVKRAINRALENIKK